MGQFKSVTFIARRDAVKLAERLLHGFEEASVLALTSEWMAMSLAV